jgi:filamentous hemagglutinin family protein
MRRRRSLGRSVRALLATLLTVQLSAPAVASALPHGAQVVGGAATVTREGTTLQVLQGTPKAIINWNGFSIGANELVRFIQPGATSAMLNRVVGGEASHILGQLLANGRIFLINPNGIIFGAGSHVNVGSLLATTLNITDSEFMAGNYVFQREHDNLSTIINAGTLRAADGGFIALSAPGVLNQGTITAKLGTVHLSSGERLALDFSGDGLVRFAVSGAIPGVPTDASGAPLPARVSNEGRISATGGDVTLTARAVGDVLTRVVNNSGVIEAGSLVNRGGVVRLTASDPVANTGRLGADVHAGEVKNAAGAVMQTGTIDVSAVEAGAAPGQVTLAGQMVGLSGSILARGLDGGPGGNVLLTSGERTIATTGSLIDASGAGAASAGHVVLWSDDLTVFRGDILARGGALGGHGGQVEISGKELLDYSGFVDTRAPLGALGSLLLDPKNITVANAGAAVPSAVDEFSDTPATSLSISPTTINNAVTNIMLQANNDITVTNAIAMTTAGASLTMLAGRSVIVNQNVSTTNGNVLIGANQQTGVVAANRDAGAGNITIASNRTVNAGTGTVTLQVDAGVNAGSISTGAMNAGAFTLTSPNAITLAGTLRARGGPIDLNGLVVLGANLTLDTTGNGTVATGAGISVDGTLNSNATARTLTVTAGTAGDVVFNGTVGATSALSGLTISSGRDVSLAQATAVTNGLATFGNTGALTLGAAGGTLTFGGGLTATAPSSTTLAGTIQTTNDVLRLGAISLGADATLRTAATNSTGDLIIGAVTGNTRALTLATGAGSGADVTGTSVSGVSTLTLQNVGGRAMFTGDVSPTTLVVPNTVANVSLIGATGTVTDPVTFANTGNLTLGSAGGTLTFTNGLTATAPATRTIAGTIATTNTPLSLGAVTLNGATTLTTNATSGAGDLSVGAVTGGSNALTLSTGAVSGADVAGASVSGVAALTLENIGGTAAFTGGVSATSLTVADSVNDVSLTGASGTITSAATFGNTGALTLGAPGGTLTFTGGLTATAPATRTLAGTIQTTNTPLTLGASTLAAATTLRTNATTAAGDLTIGAITGSGNALTLSTGSVAGADLLGTAIGGVGTLTLQTIGGTAALTDAVEVSTLSVASTVNHLSLTGTSGTVTNATTLSNVGALTLGSAGGTVTFTGGLTATAPSSRTVAGTIETANAPLVVGSVTLADDTTLRTNATTAAGDLTVGTVTGGGHNLVLATGEGVTGADLSGTGVSR